MDWNAIEEALQRLTRHAPRPGYEQRFWARVQAQTVLKPQWRWLPVAATAAGLLLGLVAGQMNAPSNAADLASGLIAEIGLPANSLADQFGRVR